MLKLNLKKSFQKDFDKLLLNGFDDSVLNKVILSLRKKEPLDPQFKDHALKGKWKPFRECHIKADILLVYLVKDDELISLRLGSHSELFCKSPAQLKRFKLTAHQTTPSLGIKFRVKTPPTRFLLFTCPRVSRFSNTLVCAFPCVSKPLHNGGFQPLF
nr:YafQ family addiction module toxin [Helicobacter pylori]